MISVFSTPAERLNGWKVHLASLMYFEKNIAKTAQPNSLLRKESTLQLRRKGIKISCGTDTDATAVAFFFITTTHVCKPAGTQG